MTAATWSASWSSIGSGSSARNIPRRPLHTPDHHLGERFNHLEELDEEDLSSLLNHLDGLIAKKRLKTIAGELA